MAYRLTYEDVQVILYDGGPSPGTPNYGAAIPITTTCKRVDIDDDIPTLDMRGMGDPTVRKRAGAWSFSADLEVLIEVTGMLGFGRGNYIQLVVLPGEGSNLVYDGLMLKQPYSVEVDGQQVQKFHIEGPPDSN